MRHLHLWPKDDSAGPAGDAGDAGQQAPTSSGGSDDQAELDLTIPDADSGDTDDRRGPGELSPRELLDQHWDHFARHGNLPPGAEAELAAKHKMGAADLGRQLRGLQAERRTQLEAVVEQAGGREQFQEMVRWAHQESASNPEIADMARRFNRLIASDNPQQRAAAVDELRSRYAGAGGPRGFDGSGVAGVPAGSGVTPFGSRREAALAAVADPDGQGQPKYVTDPNHRAEVLKRLKASRGSDGQSLFNDDISRLRKSGRRMGGVDR